jgi:uncharacterized double-CXXCG motif protein
VDFFELVPDDSWNNHIEARHRWGLPGVCCECCGATWANVGVAYPTVDLAGLANHNSYLKGWPVSWAEFEEARKPILPLLPSGALAPPGTGLGPLEGHAKGTFPEVAWQNPWTLLVVDDALAALHENGVRPVAGAAARFSERRDLPRLVELQLEPHGRLHLESPAEPPCTLCGRVAVTRPPDVVIERASLPEDHDIFRLSDLTTMIVGSVRAVSAMKALGLRGLHAQALALSS